MCMRAISQRCPISQIARFVQLARDAQSARYAPACGACPGWRSPRCRPACRRVNEGGLEMLYEIILDTARPQLAAALRLVLASAQVCSAVELCVRGGGLHPSKNNQEATASRPWYWISAVCTRQYVVHCMISAPISLVLRLLNAACSTPCQAGRPLLFFCRAGKDRTGLVAALLLSIMGASDEQILADYHRWERGPKGAARE